MATIFHFEFKGKFGWEPIGAGLGDGRRAVKEALEEVRRFSGGELPKGLYRVIESRGGDPRWATFKLDSAGRIRY